MKPYPARNMPSIMTSLVWLIFALCIGRAEAVRLYAYNFDNHHLVAFDSATPGTLVLDLPLAGLAADEYLVGIDVRPATGEIFAVATNNTTYRLVRVNSFNGSLSNVGAPIAITDPVALFFGLGFDPQTDQLRLLSNLRSNRRLSPIDGSIVATDTALAYASGDSNAAVTPQVVHIAHQRGVSGSTLFGIDTATLALVRIGGVNGTPSANGGQLSTIGPLGVAVTGFGGMAIDPAGGVAYAVLRVGSASILHTVNLATGAASSVGGIGTATVIDGLAVAAEPSPCLDIDGNGLVGAMTDALMLVRALLGMTGTAVTDNAVAVGAPRNSWPLIRAHLSTNCGLNFAQ
ncbi:MAG: DUF4394 domain-containing protein [Burkholderiales bacterium]|nr:DUF4394 domain-containing protein [Burkholderiales bacterium]